ncbi:hypothetical protein NBRC10512_006484 [Rhodotorula toruloides]|uniref:mRNA-decapping enzyme 1B n=1 Tax=Rhodotorula toruloides (strain NP11) TaxID=1130832 RepID=M7XHX0_RHOT1|nr:mRNA-decapping enzyme 1B [Rhodotorula toruloides NP11]EMS19728.1 mRNA-decapping enzyme 1B [Rhodotorula toruloides NP11]
MSDGMRTKARSPRHHQLLSLVLFELLARMALSSKEDIRRQLNLKNLQRHDPAIDRIVSSASYASVYDNKGDGWVKTGVEGPMFLFARSTSPHYGFFILNRNGLEYVQEFLTPESEVQVGGEFILYEGGQDADRATGIWVFEEKERVELCKQMEELRSRAAAIASASAQSPPSTSALPASSPLPVGQSISLDMLFQAASPTPVAPLLPQQTAQQQASNPLDALFASASISPSPARAVLPPSQPQPVPPSASKLPSTLEQLFAAASPTPQAARLPAQMPPQSPPQQPAGGMALLDSIFASAKSVPSPQQAPAYLPHPVPSPQIAHPTQPSTQSSLPYSPAPSAAQPPAPPAPASQPNDARALLAMLGHPLSPPAPPSQPVQAYPLVNGDISLAGSSTAAKSPPAPHSATYPQPFAMDQQPSTTLSKSPSAQRDEPKKEEKQSQGQGQKQPMFAPPVLSHDIFASLPLPGGAAKKKTEVAKDAEMPVQVETAKVPAKEEQDVRPNGDELAPEPQRDVEGAAAEPAKTIPSPPAAPVTVKLPILPPQLARQSSSQQPLLLDKSDITSFVNGAATNAAVGMADGAGPIEKDEFIKRKPSLSMQLYGKYLERYEEQHE